MCKKGIGDSKEYLKVILKKLNQKSIRINNVSISLEAKKPRLEKYSDKIKDSLSIEELVKTNPKGKGVRIIG